MDTVMWQRFESAGVCLSALGLYMPLEDGIVWWLAILLLFAPSRGLRKLHLLRVGDALLTAPLIGGRAVMPDWPGVTTSVS